MAISVGTLWTAGCSYECTISYDTPTRKGDNVKIKNVKATITSSSSSQTRNRIAVTASINGVSKASNKEVKRANQYDDYWPSSCEVTIIDSNGYEFSCLNKTFPISVTFRSTGYGTDWNNDNGSASKDSDISCPARTYAVTYDANGGSGAPAAQSKTYNVTLTLSSTEPTKSGHDFKGWTGSDGNTYQKGGSYTGNAALTLTAIWQAQTTDLSDVDDTAIGSAPVVKFTPPSASLTYKIRFALGSWSHTTDTISPNQTTEYTYNGYTLPLAVCEQLPDQTEGIMQVDLETYSGGTKTGTSTKYFTVTVPDTVVPSFNTIATTVAEDNGLHLFLQNYTRVKGTINCTRAYSSNIVEAKMMIGEDVKTIIPTQSVLDPTNFDAELISDVLTESGSVTVTYIIKDTRGRTKTQTITITVYEYNEPTVDIEIVYDGNQTVTCAITPFFSSVEGLNSATLSINGDTPEPCESGVPDHIGVTSEYFNSRNYTVTAVVEDAITAVTVVKKLYPGKGDRFQTLNDDEYYIGMDDKGWKDTDSTFSGSVTENGAIRFERSGGNGPIGIGFPMQMEPDSDYELIYAADRVSADTVVFMSFFSDLGSGETGISYLSSTYDGGYLESGEIFHTPQLLDSYELWGILVLGVDPQNYEQTPIGIQEFSNVAVRKIEQSEESLEWDLETGDLGLDTPNQKYISRIQQRVDYSGSLKVEIAYDNADNYTKVHESTSDHMRSITVPIKVKRSDHFRIRLSGTGEVRLYSFGYQTDEGGDRCLI